MTPLCLSNSDRSPGALLQADSSNAKAKGGTGLALAIAKQRLTAHVAPADKNDVGGEGNDGLSVTHTNAVQTHTQRRARGA
jgi:hypothetical protein